MGGHGVTPQVIQHMRPAWQCSALGGMEGKKRCCREMLLSASLLPSTFTASALGRDKFPAHGGFPCGNRAIKQTMGSLQGASFSAPFMVQTAAQWVCSHHREAKGKGRNGRSCPGNTVPFGCRSVIPAKGSSVCQKSSVFHVLPLADRLPGRGGDGDVEQGAGPKAAPRKAPKT